MHYVYLNFNLEGCERVFSHEVTRDDMIEYLWMKNYDDVIFDSSMFGLYPNGRENYKKAEQMWLNNEIDEFALTSDPDFIKFLETKYEGAAFDIWFEAEQDWEEEHFDSDEDDGYDDDGMNEYDERWDEDIEWEV